MKRTTVGGVSFSPACVGVMAVWLVGAVRAVETAGQPATKWPCRLGIVVFQFDDGSVGHYTHAFRILQKYRLKGSFGVVTGILDRPGRLTRPQVVEMHRAGHEIHDHTLDHNAALWGDPSRRDEWVKHINQSLTILKDLGITTRGWNQPGGNGQNWTEQLRLTLLPHYDYATGRVALRPEQVWNMHWHLKDDPLSLGRGGVSSWGHNAGKAGPEQEVAVVCTRIADGIQQGLVVIPLWHVVQDADRSAWGLEEVCKFVQRHQIPSMVMADAVRAVQNPRQYFAGSIEQMPNPSFAADYDADGRPDGYVNCRYAPPETAAGSGRVAEWTGQTASWIYGPEPGPTRLALTARTADGRKCTVTPILTVTSIDASYRYRTPQGQRLSPLAVGLDWQTLDTSLIVGADVDRIKLEFEIVPAGALYVRSASWCLEK